MAERTALQQFAKDIQNLVGARHLVICPEKRGQSYQESEQFEDDVDKGEKVTVTIVGVGQFVGKPDEILAAIEKAGVEKL